MKENKAYSFLEQLNLFIVGAVVGLCVGACFMTNYCNYSDRKAQAKIEAYDEYYRCTETLLDSLDGTHNLDLMDTDLETDYGTEYLDAKAVVDSLNNK